MTEPKSPQFVLLYGTCPDMDCAKSIAKALLDQKLVACVNLLPGMMSLYTWQGEMEEGTEIVFIAKTRAELWGAVSSLFAKMHPYEEPALLSLPVSAGLPGFLGWIADETRLGC